jgi:hypothetical protein
MKMDTTLISGRMCAFERVPKALLANYFVFTFPFEPSIEEVSELFTIGHRYGRERSHELTGNPDSFVLIHSGHAARRSRGWHLHVVVIRNRVEKAWLYFMLAGKNLLQVFGLWSRRVAQQGTQDRRAEDSARLS